MLLAISILLGIGFLIDLFNGKIKVLSASSLIIVLWNLLFPLAIIILVIASIMVLIKLVESKL